MSWPMARRRTSPSPFAPPARSQASPFLFRSSRREADRSEPPGVGCCNQTMFIDEIKVYARAGHGGKGAVAFHREAFVAKGGPSGGNGGRGGEGILEADHALKNLIGQYYQPKLIAQDGKGGMGKGMDGPAGKDLVVKVPCGTLVWKLPSDAPAEVPDEESDEKPVLRSSTSRRPVIRHSGRAAAMEIDLSRESDDFSAAGT